MKKIDPVETVVVMEEVVTEMENVRIDTRDSWI
ncbi:BnaA05g08510D [Brassica napus]|uniref:BnaA05g08510D protein n=1 Tax=Brassica napus TaxID=3708 RepID=A0A078CXQ2_BRANA|nr:BnaC03g27320D [Brassica napus]CDY31696.1 BnaA05g08510D [Brassica napus]